MTAVKAFLVICTCRRCLEEGERRATVSLKRASSNKLLDIFFSFFFRVSVTVWIIKKDLGFLKFQDCLVIIIKTSYQIPKTDFAILIRANSFLKYQ